MLGLWVFAAMPGSATVVCYGMIGLALQLISYVFVEALLWSFCVPKEVTPHNSSILVSETEGS